MKLNNIKVKQILFSLAGIALMFAITTNMSSCKKPGITSEVFDASHLRVVNGLRDRTGVKFYLDTFNLTLTGTLNYNTVSATYYVVNSGLRNARFYSTTSTDTFAKQAIQLDVNKEYTLYLGGVAGAPKFWFTEDEIVSGPADKAKIRLANLAVTGVNIDVTIQSEDTSAPQPKPEVKIVSNAASESVSNYFSATVPVSKGNSIPQLHTIRVYQAGTSTELLKYKGIDLRGTSINTIILVGVNGGTPAMAMRVVKEWLDW